MARFDTDTQTILNMCAESRRLALEDAAKIADEAADDYSDNDHSHHMAKEIARRIREQVEID